jgi:TRAP-type C4-dicarboxylate transport system permease large subunit
VMVVISIGIGLVTPPVGLCLYIAADIAEVRIAEGTRALMPFILTIVAILGILLLIPELILLIPQAALGAG